MLSERIHENCKNVKQEDLTKLYHSLFPYEGSIGILVDGYGRSLYGGIIGTHKLAYLPEIRIHGAHDAYLTGKNVAEAFRTLGETCKKLVYLTVSYSGETDIPLANLGLVGAIAKEMNIHVNLITGPSQSSMKKIVNICGGNILELKGRESTKTTGKRYLREGLLEDLFELGATKILSIISMGVSIRKPEEEFYGFYKEKLNELKILKKDIQSIQAMPYYNIFLSELSDPYKNFISCGQGPDDPVVKINNIRARQLRPLIVQKLGLKPSENLNIGANQNHVIGESDCPKINSESVYLAVTESGKSAKVIKYSNEARDVGAQRFITTKNGEFDVEVFRLTTRDFYPDSCIFLSQSLTDLTELLLKQGVNIDGDMLERMHFPDKGGFKLV